ncbi:MAG TPA: CoA transferase [Pseudonocardiaceae bacterium]|jgi:crotonobetainyl-CoA:carnitine CoA-transferase CaiB-like acyl-CoA transferase
MSDSSAADVFADSYAEIAGRRPTPGEVTITGDDPLLPGRFRVGAAAAACVGAMTLAAAELFRERGGDPGQVSVDAWHALLAFATERWLRVDGEPAGAGWAELSGNYRTADGWVRLHCNYPHHADAVCTALGVPADRAAVTDAVAARSAADVEAAVLAAGGAAAALRTGADWRAHPAGQAVRSRPLVAVDRIGDAPAKPLPPADRPLAGVRVLDLTHVIAGPVCGRTLAAHGADVLHVGADHLPTIRPLVIDTGFGKRSTHLDLRTEDGRTALADLVAGADVLVQSFRPGTLAARGFGPERLAGLSPGIVVVDLSAYGHTGPWRDRRGFDSLVQVATGLAADGMGDEPGALPLQALDHGTGWLSAAAVTTALRRRQVGGGSWWLRPALARTGAWLDDLGRVPAGGGMVPGPADVASLMGAMDSPFGRVDHLRVPGDLPGAQPRYENGPRLPGGDPAVWW